MSEEKPVPEITKANVFKLKPDQKLELSNDFLEALKPEIGNFAVVILTPNTKIIRIIPTSTEKIYKITIDIGKLTPDFLKRIGNLFLSLGLKALYSTGLCFVEEKCVFEGYIDSVEFESIDMNILKKEIMTVEGITDVDFSLLKVE